ncbi:glycosyl hydrolase family 18 protein [Polaromonas sp. CG_9.11]|uniref:glycosyl hydrolase family 18 protein n=1 Tax=Polaromonas sp. CG_9.11 TaxID=2787730 RepID=UPI001E286B0D|nr:glycosyl hydrolase family 18 protein [Polaromonas sp. CG_9.11]
MMHSRPKLNSITKALTGALVLCLSQAASAAEVAPYFHSWGGSLNDAKQSVGMNSAILSFATTNGSCALVPDLTNKLEDARNYVAAGGRLLISFGGAHGVYAEVACRNDDQLFSLMENLMRDSNSRRFDFDIEGHQLKDVEATARRARVLARLQAKYPDLYISFSLPGWLLGFDPNSMNLLNTTVAAGVRIDMVNVMTQSFGVQNLQTMVPSSTVGEASVMTFRAAVNQMTAVFRNKTQAQLHAMMGITPMIGKNDDGSTFTLDDAYTVANFAKQNGVGLISYWSFQRDRAQSSNGSTNLGSFSGVAQSDFQFYNIFNSSGGFVTAAAAPAQAAAVAGTCSAAGWSQGKQYAAGSIVSYPDRKLYIAKFANPGYNPTISTYYWSQYVC